MSLLMRFFTIVATTCTIAFSASALAATAESQATTQQTGGLREQKKVVNFRVQTLPLIFSPIATLAQNSRYFSAQIDVDWIVAPKFSFGPSIFFNTFGKRDGKMEWGNTIWLDYFSVSPGLQATYFFTGTNAEGGFGIRPQVNLDIPFGSRNVAQYAISVPAKATLGINSTVQLLYRWAWPSGFNMEVSGGVTFGAPARLEFPDRLSSGTNSLEGATIFPALGFALGWMI